MQIKKAQSVFQQISIHVETRDEFKIFLDVFKVAADRFRFMSEVHKKERRSEYTAYLDAAVMLEYLVKQMEETK